MERILLQTLQVLTFIACLRGLCTEYVKQLRDGDSEVPHGTLCEQFHAYQDCYVDDFGYPIRAVNHNPGEGYPCIQYPNVVSLLI